MGRKRISMEMISNANTRSSVYKARKTSLMKKALELTTLCNVKACMIIYRGDPVTSNFQDQEPEIWPPDPHQVNCVLSAYREKRRSEQERHGMMKRSRMCDLSSFLEEKKRSMVEELEKSRKRNRQAKYPAWFDFMNNFSEADLRELAMRLEKKIEAAKSKAALIKARRLVNNNVVGDERIPSEPPLLTFRNNVDDTTFDPQLGYVNYPTLGHEPMMALMMRDANYDQCNTCLNDKNKQLVAPMLMQGERYYYYDGSIDTHNMNSGIPDPLPLMNYY